MEVVDSRIDQVQCIGQILKKMVSYIKCRHSELQLSYAFTRYSSSKFCIIDHLDRLEICLWISWA
jgi:hypothetical protein